MKSTTYYFKLSTLLLLLSFIPIWAIAQSNTVKGTVKDTFGEAVIGANDNRSGHQQWYHYGH